MPRVSIRNIIMLAKPHAFPLLGIGALPVEVNVSPGAQPKTVRGANSAKA
jgi:hypothetical protein